MYMESLTFAGSLLLAGSAAGCVYLLYACFLVRRFAARHRLAATFPDADLSLVVERGRSAGNLKVANLQNMLPAVRHEFIVIADSDMRVAPDYLALVTAPLADTELGLVTCLYRGLPAGGFWSRLACLHVN